MDFGQAIKTCFNKYATFTGRAGRPEFWWFFLFQVIALAAASMFGETLYGVTTLALLLPALAVGARRLHDVRKSAWFLLLGFIPVLGFLILLYWCAQQSDPQANEYGSLPGSEEPAALPPGAV